MENPVAAVGIMRYMPGRLKKYDKSNGMKVMIVWYQFTNTSLQEQEKPHAGANARVGSA